jgi:hypothetical protein
MCCRVNPSKGGYLKCTYFQWSQADATDSNGLLATDFSLTARHMKLPQSLRDLAGRPVHTGAGRIPSYGQHTTHGHIEKAEGVIQATPL